MALPPDMLVKAIGRHGGAGEERLPLSLPQYGIQQDVRDGMAVSIPTARRPERRRNATRAQARNVAKGQGGAFRAHGARHGERPMCGEICARRKRFMSDRQWWWRAMRGVRSFLDDEIRRADRRGRGSAMLRLGRRDGGMGGGRRPAEFAPGRRRRSRLAPAGEPAPAARPASGNACAVKWSNMRSSPPISTWRSAR